MGLPQAREMNRRIFLKTTAGTAALLMSRAPWISGQEKAGLTNEEILAQTKQRIEQHRKGDGVIVLRDAKGKPIQAATVKVEQLRHDFLFGCNAFMVARLKKAEREEEYRRRFARLLNYATLGFYWGAYEPERGKPNYDYTDKVVEWCGA